MRPRQRTGLVQGPMWEVGLVEPESFRSEVGHPTPVAVNRNDQSLLRDNDPDSDLTPPGPSQWELKLVSLIPDPVSPGLHALLVTH